MTSVLVEPVFLGLRGLWQPRPPELDAAASILPTLTEPGEHDRLSLRLERLAATAVVLAETTAHAGPSLRPLADGVSLGRLILAVHRRLAPLRGLADDLMLRRCGARGSPRGSAPDLDDLVVRIAVAEEIVARLAAMLRKALSQDCTY